MNKNDRAKKIDRGMRLVYDSLQSHLEDTHTPSSGSKKYADTVGDKNFHKKCVKEYAEVIGILADLY